MQKSMIISVDEDIYEKYRIALELTHDASNAVMEYCMKWYISRSFEKACQLYDPESETDRPEEAEVSLRGMAKRKIPMWARKPRQYNHKIIRAYFKAQETAGVVTLEELEKLCGDMACPETYVPTFRMNYAQMKLDAPKSHGKVFEDDGETVTIWSEVKDVLMKNKASFV